MTRILALETAGETCSVALLDGSEVLEKFEMAPRKQTELVLPMVESLLAEASVSLAQLFYVLGMFSRSMFLLLCVVVCYARKGPPRV